MSRRQRSLHCIERRLTKNSLVSGVALTMYTKIPALRTNVPSLRSSVPALRTNVPPIQTKVPAVRTNVPALQTKVPALRSSVPALHASVPALRTKVSVLRTKVSALQTNVPTLRTSDTALQTKDPVLRTSDPTLRSNIPTLRTSVPTIRTTVPPLRRNNQSNKRILKPIASPRLRKTKIKSNTLPFDSTHGCGRSSTTNSVPTTLQPVVEETIAAATAAPTLDRAGGTSGRSSSRSSTPRASPVSNNELKQLTEELLTLDTGILQPSVSHQGHTSASATGDSASHPLIANVPREAVAKTTVQRMQRLLDNYEPRTTSTEVQTADELAEENSFLDAVMQTPLMKRLETFLQQKNLIRGGLRSTLKDIWFTLYRRGGRHVGSSGFEHVFVGELKDGKVAGFHNWLNFRKEELEGDLDYKGFIRFIDLNGKGQIVKLRFEWLNEAKPVGTVFIGTTPELEMALYTLCFLVRPDSSCQVQLAGKKFSIQTWTFTSGGKKVIGSAYPNI
ncbi:uridylate-specific endoribonuclease D-like isoform X1 [Cherax quadricarinatus]|uniref:uridylate-specific endoribonuclease D-like isoform X1 n=1 Tax=Cherax quadricarinatus TaxID=27406 RepID=UPI00387E8B1D